MRRDAVEKLLEKTNANWKVIHKLIKSNKLIELDYNNNKFYLRKM